MPAQVDPASHELGRTREMYFVAPMMLGKPMDISAMLGGMLGSSWAMGLLMHCAN